MVVIAVVVQEIEFVRWLWWVEIGRCCASKSVLALNLGTLHAWHEVDTTSGRWVGDVGLVDPITVDCLSETFPVDGWKLAAKGLGSWTSHFLPQVGEDVVYGYEIKS